MGEWRVQVSVRVSPERRTELEQCAERERRTLANFGALYWSGRSNNSRRPDDFVFCKKDGSALDPDVLRKDALYPILDRLGIPRKKGASGFHTFRHSAVSIVNEQTGNLKLAQKFLGHSTIKMTADIYTHTSAEAERDAAIALERAIYGDLFPVVPNIENRNNFAALN
jgi:site-specific recombinase XerD